ncbi:MAG: hypothetical protein AAGA50_27665 [Pseudomonadota bacterium]
MMEVGLPILVDDTERPTVMGNQSRTRFSVIGGVSIGRLNNVGIRFAAIFGDRQTPAGFDWRLFGGFRLRIQ